MTPQYWYILGVSLPSPSYRTSLVSLGTRGPYTPYVLLASRAPSHKHSDNCLSTSLSCCSYGSEVFRSCRKQSYGRKLTPALAPHPLSLPSLGFSSPCLSYTLMPSVWFGAQDSLVLLLVACLDSTTLR